MRKITGTAYNPWQKVFVFFKIYIYIYLSIHFDEI